MLFLERVNYVSAGIVASTSNKWCCEVEYFFNMAENSQPGYSGLYLVRKHVLEKSIHTGKK
jgi:hypothetical protein